MLSKLPVCSDEVGKEAWPSLHLSVFTPERVLEVPWNDFQAGDEVKNIGGTELRNDEWLFEPWKFDSTAKSRQEWLRNVVRGNNLADEDLRFVFDGEISDLRRLQERIAGLQNSVGCYASIVRGYLQRLYQLGLISEADVRRIHRAVSKPHWHYVDPPDWVLDVAIERPSFGRW